jgi:DNA-directed RNA polymerase specialized sigma subunit
MKEHLSIEGMIEEYQYAHTDIEGDFYPTFAEVWNCDTIGSIREIKDNDSPEETKLEISILMFDVKMLSEQERKIIISLYEMIRDQ